MFFQNDNNVGINDFSRSVEQYYSELSDRRHRPLTREEERELIKKAQNGDLTARNAVIDSNLRFVFNIAKKYRGRGVDIEDLISVGNEGLMEALENFDLDRQVKFISYAVWKIRQNMSNLIQETKDRESVEMPNIYNDERSRQPYMYDEENEETNDGTWDVCDSEPLFIKIEEKDQKNTVINILLNSLEEREKKVIQMLYAINEEEKNYTLEEVGKELSLSTERVRQLKYKAINDMRCNVFDVDAADFMFK